MRLTISPGNAPSERLASVYGFVPVGEQWDDEDGREVVVRAGRHGALLRVLRCDRVLDKPVDGVWASDHFGVTADLAVPEHAPDTWATAP